MQKQAHEKYENNNESSKDCASENGINEIRQPRTNCKTCETFFQINKKGNHKKNNREIRQSTIQPTIGN